MKNLSSSLAIMQADIDKAIRAKRQANIDDLRVVTHTVKEGGDKSIETSNERLLKATNVAFNKVLSVPELSRVIEMAWEDRTPFTAIAQSYGLSEADVIILMRQELKPSSFRLWRQRVSGRVTKHQAKRSFIVGRAYCKTQYKPQ